MKNKTNMLYISAQGHTERTVCCCALVLTLSKLHEQEFFRLGRNVSQHDKS
jgi:hypothetical protein